MRQKVLFKTKIISYNYCMTLPNYTKQSSSNLRQELANQKNKSNQILYGIFAVLATFCLVFGIAFFGTNQQTALASDHDETVQIIHNLVNEERTKNNLSPLSWNKNLATAAQTKTKDMVEKKYFAHISPVDGKKWSEFILSSNYDYKEAGENLAVGYTQPKAIVEAWMNSHSHRENILSPGFEEGGIAISVGEWKGVKTYFVAQEFGRK